MRFGPTSLKVTTVLAKGLRRQRLRSDLRISEQVISGKKSYVIKVPDTSTYSRYGAYEYEILTLCDGTRTPAEIAAEMSERHPEQPVTETTVLEFFDGMEAGMWERSVGEKNLAMLEKIRDERKTRVNRANILQITFKAWDPNETLARMDPYFSWMFTTGFVLFSLVLFTITAAIWISDWNRISLDAAAFYDFGRQTPDDLLLFWVLLFVISGIHELGHGLTCRHFGGEVHQMGFMLIYFSPAFYTDTTDVYMFDRTSRREWVIFAGLWIEFVVCSLATIVWYFSSPGTVIAYLSYRLLLFSSIAALVMNLNPFIKADGYYALSQYLRMDSLREESLAYVKTLFEQHILRRDVEPPSVTKRQRRIFISFGLATFAYSLMLLYFVGFWAKDTLVGWWGLWGYPALAVILYFMLRKKVRERLPAARLWLRNSQEEFMAWKMTRRQQLVAGLAAFLLFVPPLPSRVSTDFVLEPATRAEVRTTVAGEIREVRVKQGDAVHAGDVLVVLENPELEATAQSTQNSLALAEASIRSAAETGNSAELAKATGEAQRLEQDLAVDLHRTAGLTVRSPIDGVVASPDIDQRSGEYVDAGADLTDIVNRQAMRARILVRDWDFADVHPQASAQLKVGAYPYRTFQGHVERIMPAAAAEKPVAADPTIVRYGRELTNYFAVVLDFPNPDGSLQEGMTGTAKISGNYRPAAWQVARSFSHWLRTQVW
jgi:putative peptide zinc metalloprotease protein